MVVLAATLVFVAGILIHVGSQSSRPVDHSAFEGIGLPDASQYGSQSDSRVAVSGPGAVSTSSSYASAAGAEMLELGGNAVDAAVAAAYALAVVEPYASGPGGGGGAVISFADGSGRPPLFVDFRDVADATGAERKDRFSIPGFVMGMEHMVAEYGNLTMSEVMAPAIKLAEDGFEVNSLLAELLLNYQDKIGSAAAAYGGLPVAPGTVITQPEMAQTLNLIAAEGPRAFYDDVVSSAYPNLDYQWSQLQESLVVVRTPVKKEIQGRTLYSAPAPFAGSVALQLTDYLAASPAAVLSNASPDSMADYFRYVDTVYEQRRAVLGDPAFGGENVPLDESSLTQTQPGLSAEPEESVTTTQVSVVDKDGGAVSMTVTLGEFFGNGKLVGGFFSNESLQFAKEGINTAAPYKKPRTFMSPTIVIHEGTVTAVGTPGGNRIPQVLAQYLSADWALSNITAAGDMARITVDGDLVSFEDFPTQQVENGLSGRGFRSRYITNRKMFFGSVNLAERAADGTVSGYSDPRRLGMFMQIESGDNSEDGS